jgi:hypothetical protein
VNTTKGTLQIWSNEGHWGGTSNLDHPGRPQDVITEFLVRGRQEEQRQGKRKQSSQWWGYEPRNAEPAVHHTPRSNEQTLPGPCQRNSPGTPWLPSKMVFKTYHLQNYKTINLHYFKPIVLLTCYSSNRKLKHRVCSDIKDRLVKSAVTWPHQSKASDCNNEKQCDCTH